MTRLTLISHHLCPYVQRAAVSLSEKNVAYERIDVDLADKPNWFLTLSPLGKVPLLRVTNGDVSETIFESAVILEYLEETQPNPLHPVDPLQRARHRSWMEFGSSTLNRIGAFYNAPSEPALQDEADKLSVMFARVEEELGHGPWFAGERFSLVDAVYGAIFRYFDTFDRIGDFPFFANKPKTIAWRQALSERRSIRDAVSPDYPQRLLTFLQNRGSAISARVKAQTSDSYSTM